MAKKLKSVDDIIKDTQSVRGKNFNARMGKFEEFYKPESQHALRFKQHAEYVVWGKPSDREKYPGAYDSAYKELDRIAKEDIDKLKKEDDILKVLEAYADKFLEHAMGSRFKDAVEQAKKDGVNEDIIRTMKNNLLTRYLHDEQGNPLLYLSKETAKKHKGKTKAEMIEVLRSIADSTVSAYHGHLMRKALEGVIRHEDILDVYKHVKPKFEEAGLEHTEHYLTESAEALAAHYGLLLSGATETLTKKMDYRKISKEKKK